MPKGKQQAPAQFEMVDGSTPVPEGHIRLLLGQVLHWSGLRMRLKQVEGLSLTFVVEGVTGKATKKYNRNESPLKISHRGRRARSTTQAGKKKKKR